MEKMIIIIVSTITTYVAMYIMAQICLRINPSFVKVQYIPYAMISLPIIFKIIETLKDDTEIVAL